MLCSEIIAVCSQIRTKHINTLCGQNVEMLNVKLAVRPSQPLYSMTTGALSKSAHPVSPHSIICLLR
jgi:hypothetical protein